MGFETPPMPSSKRSEEEKIPKPRFIVGSKESPRTYTIKAFEKIEPLAENMNEKKVDSILSPIVSPVLKEKRDSIIDDLSWREKNKRDGNIDDENRINSLERDLESASERLNNFDALRSKIALNKELNPDEMSQLISYVNSAINTLDNELYSINKDKEQDKYNGNREKAKQLHAAELFLVRKKLEK